MAKRVLVVDDEPNIVMSLRFLMEREGFEVEVASTGQAAVTALAGPPADLVLLDVMMPGLDGFEVCQRIRAAPAWHASKIVMLTAKGRDVERDKGHGARRRRLRDQAVLDARPGGQDQADARLQLKRGVGAMATGVRPRLPADPPAAACAAMLLRIGQRARHADLPARRRPAGDA